MTKKLSRQQGSETNGHDVAKVGSLENDQPDFQEKPLQKSEGIFCPNKAPGPR